MPKQGSNQANTGRGRGKSQGRKKARAPPPEEEEKEEEEPVVHGPDPDPGDNSSNSSSSEDGTNDSSNDDDDDANEDIGGNDDGHNDSDDGASDNESEDDDEVSENSDGSTIGVLPNGLVYSVPFLNKLISFRLTRSQAIFIVDNGATTPFTFARFFSKTALKNLLHPKRGIGKIRIESEEHIKALHRWLQQKHSEGEDLKVINLERFTDEVMETLVEEDINEGAARERNSGSKESGATLPTFNGNQPAYAIWYTRLRTYLCSMKNEEGMPLWYVIADIKKEKPELQRLWKTAKYTGKIFDRDNFRVAQWLESSLAEGPAHVYAKKHSGDAKKIFKDLHEVYHAGAKKETRIKDLQKKLRSIQYRGAKNFGWEKFSSTLQGYYEEMETLGEPITSTSQVRDLVEMIHHPKTKDIASDVIFTWPAHSDKQLISVMSGIATRMSIQGVNPAAAEGGNEASTGTRQIRKLKRKEKALKKKLYKKNSENKQPAKSDQDPADYIPKETIEAIKKAAVKHGSKVVAWAFKGRAADIAEKRNVHGVKSDEVSEGSEAEEEDNTGKRCFCLDGTGLRQSTCTEPEWWKTQKG